MCGGNPLGLVAPPRLLVPYRGPAVSAVAPAAAVSFVSYPRLLRVAALLAAAAPAALLAVVSARVPALVPALVAAPVSASVSAPASSAAA